MAKTMSASSFLDDDAPSAADFLDQDDQPSAKDKIYKAANSLFKQASVMEGKDGRVAKPDGFIAAPVKEIAAKNIVENRPVLTKGADIVDGFSGIAEVGARKGYAGIGRISAGAIKMLADVLGSDTLSNTAQSQRNYANEVEGGAVLRGTPVEGFSKESIVQDLPIAATNAIGSIITTAPAIGAAVATGGSALPAIFATTGAQEYGDGREQGLSPAGAAIRAVPQAAFEVIGEKLGGLGKITDGLRRATKGNGVADLGAAMMQSAVKELPSEEFTTTGQFLVDKAPGVGLNQEAGLDEYRQQVKDTALATILQSAGMGAGGSAINSIANAKSSKPIEDAPIEPQPAPFDADSLVKALTQAQELVAPKQALTISNGTEEAAALDDAVSAQKQSEYDADLPSASAFLDGAQNAPKTSPELNGNSFAEQFAEAEQVATENTPEPINKPTRKQASDNPLFEKNREAIESLVPRMNWGTIGNKRIDDAQGNQVGRTKYEPIDDAMEELRKQGTLSYNAMREAVGKAINGKPLSKSEQRTIDLIADYAENNEIAINQPITDETLENVRAFKAQEDAITGQSEGMSFDELVYDLDTTTAKVAVTELDDDALDSGIGNLVSADEFEAWLNAEGTNNEQTTDNERIETQTGRDDARGARGESRENPQWSSAERDQQQPAPIKPQENQPTRLIVEALVKRRAAANQLGKSKAFDAAIEAAKAFMNGEQVSPSKFKNAASLFKNDKILTEKFTELQALSKLPAKEARADKTNAIEAYKQRIAGANTIDALQALAGEIQRDSALSDSQAATLDDAVFEAQDALDVEDSDTDLLGENTQSKQAIADAERAKDAKRNAGSDNASEFNLTGSNSEADKAAASGAQDLFQAKQNKSVYDNAYEKDLFGNALPASSGRVGNTKNTNKSSSEALSKISGETDTVAPDAEYYVNTIIGVTANKKLGAAKVTSSEQLAQATYYLNKSAVERLDGVVTDKAGNPLVVIGGFKGATTSSAVYPSTLMAEAVRIPNAAHLWLSHNHPSGLAELSSADKTLFSELKNVFDGSGIEVKGLIAVAKDEYASIDSEGVVGFQAIPTSTTSVTVPVIERELQDEGVRHGSITSPTTAKAIASAFHAKAKQNGIILTDAQNRVIAWLPLSDALTGNLKHTGALNSLYRAVSQSNAVSAFIAHDGSLSKSKFSNGQTPIENIGRALRNIEVNLLDAINVKDILTAQESGESLAGEVVFSNNTNQGTLTVADVKKAIANDIYGQEVDVYQTMADAPVYVQVQAKSEGASGVEGFFDKKTNRVALIADNIADAKRAVEVARHELIGHYGIENMLGDNLFTDLTNRVIAAEKSGNKTIVEVSKQVDDTQPGLDEKRRAGEIIAVMAERNLQNSITKQVIDAIRLFLKKIGFITRDITDAKIAGLLRDAQVYLKAQGRSVIEASDSNFSNSTSRKPITVDTRDNFIFRRDALGRIQLTATGKMYDVISNITQNIADKAQFGMASPELRKLIRHFKADMAKALDSASDVAKKMSPMSVANRALVSDVVEGMLKTGVMPPEHVVKIAAGMQQTMDAQTDELVKLGMLSKESADRWRGKYLPRFYNREQDPSLNTLAKKLFRAALPVRGMGGGSLKGRGLYQEINVNELSQWESLGWEVRDPLWKQSQTGKLELIDQNKVRYTEKVMVWRDFTPSERESMGENRDALFRYVMGYTAMQNDIALGRMFDSIAKNQEWTRSRASEGFTKIPDADIPETGGVKKYGNLAGLYVRDDIIQHITQYEESGELLKFYRKALGLWKMGKTVLNPVSHMNNVVSNLTMAHFAGVSYWDTHKYIGALRDFVQNAPMIQEAKDAGLMTGDITRTELIADMPADIKAMMNQKDSKITKTARNTYNILTFGLTRPMSASYRFEDDFFKYLIYKDARNNGVEPDDAVDYATRYIFNYDDLPKGARAVRDSAIPFFAYTYKAIPALAHTAFNYPWRFAAPALAIGGLNALMYGLAAGDDDDDLQTKIAKGKELEAEERKNLPPWMQGKSALGTQKAIRLGTDEKTGLPVFIDLSRMIPGGDVFDITNQTDGMPLPAPIMPSNPVLTTIAAMLWNKDTFSGKDVVDAKVDTAKEAAQKRAEWLLKQLSPAIAPTGYHADRLAQAAATMADDTIETPFKDYTGFGKDGLPVQPKYAALQTIGIKARPIDLEYSADMAESKEVGQLFALKREMKRLASMLDKKAISQREYDLKEKEIETKMDAIENKD